MKHILVALALVGTTFLAQVQGSAPTPASIEKLMALTQDEKIVDAIKPQMNAMMKASMDQAMQGRKPSPDQQKLLEDYVAKVSRIMADNLSFDRFKSIFVDLYSRYYTQEEVDGVIAFYESPAGKSMITKMPKIMQGVVAAMPAAMAPMTAQLKQASEQLAKDFEALKKKEPKAKK